MTQQDKDRKAFERFMDKMVGTSSCYPEDYEYKIWQAARYHYAPKPETLMICGLTAAEVSRLHTWFESQAGRSFTSFWEEAFDAGVNQTKELIAPKLTEREATERAAEAFCRSTDVYDPSAMVVALRAAGLRFKEEA